MSVMPTRMLERLTSEDLDDGDYQIRYIVDNVLPVGECGTIAAKSKALKTHTAVELGIAVATGTPFLGYFPTLEPMRVGIISGESGKGALQEMGRRISAARGLKLRDIASLIWSTTVPRLPRDAQIIEQFIINNGLGLLMIDPTYYLLRDVGDDLANATKIGAALELLSEIAHRTGCTIVLVAHNRKGRGVDQRRFDPPTLEEIAGAGLDQWVRFWLLLGPRKEFDGDAGRHWLWFRTGGSAGHGNLFSLDVFEGRRTDDCGRVWTPTVNTATDERQQREAEKERKAIEAAERTLSANVCKLRAALKKHPDGETEKKLRTAAKLNPDTFAAALEVLDARGEIADVRIKKAKQTYEGYAWKNPGVSTELPDPSGPNDGVWSDMVRNG